MAKRERLTETEADLKATAEDLVADAARVQAIEGEKAQLDATDPRLPELSKESEALTRQMAHKAHVETILADEANESVPSD